MTVVTSTQEQRIFHVHFFRRNAPNRMFIYSREKKFGGLAALKLIKFPSLFFSQENLSTTEAVAGDQREWGGQMKTKPGSRA